jgi:hypothetical protein
MVWESAVSRRLSPVAARQRVVEPAHGGRHPSGVPCRAVQRAHDCSAFFVGELDLLDPGGFAREADLKLNGCRDRGQLGFDGLRLASRAKQLDELDHVFVGQDVVAAAHRDCKTPRHCLNLEPFERLVADAEQEPRFLAELGGSLFVHADSLPSAYTS